MSTLGRNDAFSVVGGAPNARFVEGHVSRVNLATTPPQVFVVAPTFDVGAEFGPVRYSGAPPPVDTEVIVAVMTGTTEAWIVSADLPTQSLTLDTWRPLPLAVGVTPYGSVFNTPGFWRDPMGIVHLRGLLHAAGAPTGAVLANLPLGYRPPATELVHGTAGYSGGNLVFRFDVNADGSITISASSGVSPSYDFMSLDGITFQVAVPPTTIPGGPPGPQGPKGDPGSGTPVYVTCSFTSGAQGAAGAGAWQNILGDPGNTVASPGVGWTPLVVGGYHGGFYVPEDGLYECFLTCSPTGVASVLYGRCRQNAAFPIADGTQPWASLGTPANVLNASWLIKCFAGDLLQFDWMMTVSPTNLQAGLTRWGFVKVK